MESYNIYLVIIGILLALKLMFWTIYFLYRRQRQRRLLEAGLIRPAVPNVWSSTQSDMANQGNYNTQYWTVTPTGPTAPPPYEAVAGKQGQPPSYQEAGGYR